MRKLIMGPKFWSGVITLVGAIGCSHNIESQFLASLNASSDKQVCVDESELGVSRYSSRDGKSYLAAADTQFGGKGPINALDALRDRGYIQKEPFAMQVNFGHVRGYEITEKGLKHFQPRGPVCIGEKHATEIVDYTESQGGGAVQGSQVNFKYEVRFNDMVEDLGLAEALAKNLTLIRNTEGKGSAVFVKTNKGWRLESAMW